MSLLLSSILVEELCLRELHLNSLKSGSLLSLNLFLYLGCKKQPAYSLDVRAPIQSGPLYLIIVMVYIISYYSKGKLLGRYYKAITIRECPLTCTSILLGKTCALVVKKWKVIYYVLALLPLVLDKLGIPNIKVLY
ncbi:hypothetical protein HDK77DRAFT_428887 [Phyllosticta capitalensis]